jgi:hypothetical protein
MKNLKRFNEEFDWDEVLKQNRKEGTDKWSSLEKDMIDIAEKYEGQFGSDSYGIVDAMYQVLDSMFQKKESKKEESEEIKFDVKSLEKDKDEKPSFKTSIDDQEKLDKEFKKELNKVEKFESFITITITNNDDKLETPDNFNGLTDEFDSDEESEISNTCCDVCSGEDGCQCCDQCKCGESEESQVMNVSDFLKSIIN